MRTSPWAPVLSAFIAITACGGGGRSTPPPNPPPPPPPAPTGSYVVTAWGELGMHCMDGKDYSVLAVLPPYNTIHAQVIKRGDPPSAPSNVSVTYEAVADASGSTNTSSARKTNFWTFVGALFGTSPAPDVGLTGVAVQSATPRAMTYNASTAAWDAVGIPTVPYDDAGNRNAYPMAKITVKDQAGNLLASTTVVLAVSDELTCSTCHASGGSSAAQPAAGWENDPDASRDTRLNILRKHDDRVSIAPYLTALHSKGYTYQATLYQTAKSGTPVLCAACHATNALGAAGVNGIGALTADIHTLHGSTINPATAVALDRSTTPEGSCYLCHPGLQTKCQRGAMNKVACFDCHGNLTTVGASTRQGWIDLPSCQMCHNTGKRYTTTFDSATAAWRVTTDSTFATNPGKPAPGKSLYKLSTGHGGVSCASCHGSQHAEYPTLQANDNLYSTALQGYAGKIVECTVCHLTMPSTQTGGPHGLHTIGQPWVSAHPQYAANGASQCAYCHGSDFRGTALSALPTARTFTGEDIGTKTFSAGHPISCYDCHNGPHG